MLIIRTGSTYPNKSNGVGGGPWLELVPILPTAGLSRVTGSLTEKV